MEHPPAVKVHGLAMVQQALCCAEATGLPVTLLSAEGAAASAGVGWWRALMAAGAAAHPDARFRHILDCGRSPGRALEALRAGQTLLVLRADPRIWADIAERVPGATLLAAPPPALDLAPRGAARLLAVWLRNGGASSPGPGR